MALNVSRDRSAAAYIDDHRYGGWGLDLFDRSGAASAAGARHSAGFDGTARNGSQLEEAGAIDGLEFVDSEFPLEWTPGVTDEALAKASRMVDGAFSTV